MTNESALKIKQLYGELNYMSSSYVIERTVGQILELLQELQGDEAYRETAIRAYVELDHTAGKEVKWNNSAYDAMNKRNAAKVRTNEYYKSAESLLEQVFLDIHMIFHVEDEPEAVKPS